MAPAHRFLAIAVLAVPAALAGCQARRAPVSAPAPASPEAAVAAFLTAVDSGDLGRMAELWGTDRGPSTVVIRNDTDRERRLAVMQRLLAHDRYRFVPPPTPVAALPARQVLFVELTRGEHTATVPFTTVPARGGGWLVEAVALDAAMPIANPRRPRGP